MTARISIVVPVLGDTAALAKLLPQLAAATPQPVEIIVVDGGDDDECRAVCDAAGARHLVSTPGRGPQLNAGASVAVGDALWFLHADHCVGQASTAAIAEALDEGADGGYFQFEFAGERAARKTFLEGCINWRARIGVPYGDQGLFMTRAAFHAAGGFADTPLFEEVPLVKTLRRRGHLIPLRATIGVSCRRWDRDGWWQRTLANRALAIGYMLGIAPETLARHYRGAAGGLTAAGDR